MSRNSPGGSFFPYSVRSDGGPGRVGSRPGISRRGEARTRVVHSCHLRRGEASMETTTMGKVLVAAKIESLEDLFNAEKGLLPQEQVRRIEVPDALVDTGATGLLVPKRMIS